MIIQGNYQIEATNGDVWKCLMDPDVLERIIPGVSELIHLGDDHYKAISKIKIGPVQGNFVGQFDIRDKVDSTSATLVINQKSKIGNVIAEIKVQLSTIENMTNIDYTGDAKLSGKIAMMGQRLIGGLISSLSKQFFIALNNEINS